MPSLAARARSPVTVAAGCAVGLNALATAGCIGLAARAPTRAGALVAGAGFVFFTLAAIGFGVLLRLAQGARRRRDA